MKSIRSSYCSALITEIRDQVTPQERLRERLFHLGRIMGEEIIGDELTNSSVVKTPMNFNYEGLRVMQSLTAIVSTRDDYKYFASGIASPFEGAIRGYMDFGGLRGPEALTSPIRAIDLPGIKQGQFVKTLIIAKSILATGCTAIHLTRKAIEMYNPQTIIIASVFYSDIGINDVSLDLPQSKIYVFGNPDVLNEDGMLIPGVGNLDTRLNAENVQ